MANTSAYKSGQDWGRQHPNMPAPPKAPQDFKNGVNDSRKK